MSQELTYLAEGTTEPRLRRNTADLLPTVGDSDDPFSDGADATDGWGGGSSPGAQSDGSAFATSSPQVQSFFTLGSQPRCLTLLPDSPTLRLPAAHQQPLLSLQKPLLFPSSMLASSPLHHQGSMLACSSCLSQMHVCA